MAHTFDTKIRWMNSANPSTQAYTCGTGATVLVLTIIGLGNTQRTGAAPTFNGITMTQAGSWIGGTGYEEGTEVWYLTSPPTGAEYTISIPNTTPHSLRCIASSYIAQAGYNSVLDDVQSNKTTGANPSVSITATVDGDAVIGSLGSGRTNVPSGRNGTILYEVDTGNQCDDTQYILMAGQGVQAASWTIPSDNWTCIVVAFREYAPPPPMEETVEIDAVAATDGHTYFKIVPGMTSYFAEVIEAKFTSCKMAIVQYDPPRPYTNLRDEVYISLNPILDRGESLTPYHVFYAIEGTVAEPYELDFTGLTPGKKYYAAIIRYLDDVYYGMQWPSYNPFTIDNNVTVGCASPQVADFSGDWCDELTPYSTEWIGAVQNYPGAYYNKELFAWWNDITVADPTHVLGGDYFIRKKGVCDISRIHLDQTDAGGATISFKFRIGSGIMPAGGGVTPYLEFCWYSSETEYAACLFGRQTGTVAADNALAYMPWSANFWAEGRVSDWAAGSNPHPNPILERNTVYEFQIVFTPGETTDTVEFKLDGYSLGIGTTSWKWVYPAYLWMAWTNQSGDSIGQPPFQDINLDIGPISFSGKFVYGNVDYSDTGFWESVTARNTWARAGGNEFGIESANDVIYETGGLIPGLTNDNGATSTNFFAPSVLWCANNSYNANAGTYELRTPNIKPETGYKYGTIKIGGTQGTSSGTSLKIQFVDKDNNLISNDYITNNSSGFFPEWYDFVEVDATAIPFAGIKAEITGYVPAVCPVSAAPRLQLLTISFTPGDLSGFTLDPVTSPTNITWQTITGDRAAEATIVSTGDMPGVFFDTTSYTSETTWMTVVRNLAYGDNQLTFRQDDGGVYSYEYGFITETGLAKRSLEAMGLDEKDNSRKLLSWIITEAMDLSELKSMRKFIAEILIDAIGITEKSYGLVKKVYRFVEAMAISEKDLLKKTIVAAIIDAFGIISDFVRSQFNTVLIGTPATVFVGNSPFTITKPTSVVSGDLLVASIVADTTSVIGWPANWTEDRTNTYSSNRISIGHKIATGSEPANYTFTAAGASVAGISMVRLYNSISMYEYDDGNDSQYTTSNNQYPFPTISTDVSGEAIVYFAVELTGTPTATWPGTMELTDNSGVSMGAETFLNHGTSTQRSVTWSITSNNKIGIMGSYRAKSGLALLKSLIENMSIAENKKAMLILRRIMVDAVNIADKILTVKAWRRVLLETVGIADKVLRFKAMSRIAVDAVGIFEKSLRAIRISRLSVEWVGFADLAGRLKGLKRGVAQTIDIAENSVRKMSAFLKAVVVESISIVEKSLRIRTFFRRSVESLGLTEKALRTRRMARLALEGMATADIVLRAEKLSRVILDAIGLSDLSNIGRSLRRVSSEAIGISDKILKSVSAAIKKVLVEAVGITDKSLHSIHTIIRRATVEIVAITEKALRSRTLSRVTAEVIAISDKVLDIITAAVAVIKTIIESLGITEKPVNKLLHIIKVITVEAVGIAQNALWFSIGGLVDAVTAANRIFTAQADHIKTGLKSQINRFRAFVKNNILKGGE